MAQIHKRLTDEQVRAFFQSYCQGTLSRMEIQKVLEIGKTRFFTLLKAFREDAENFTIAYHRKTPRKLSSQAEDGIKKALLREKKIVVDPDLPISGYNYSAIRDRLKKEGVHVSVPTIINRAKQLDCHKPRKKKKSHDREVLTESIGALIQHDASKHLWAPLAKEKWYLITSIDDYSRKLLFADFFTAETSWAHIQAAQKLIQTYGIPFKYYVDSLRVFRFVQGRDSFWRKHVLETDDVDTQWKKVMEELSIRVTHALSPQAKGKIERPYRWLQDRIVRTCIYENLSSIEEARMALKDEVDRYNNHQVHSTTKEIPSVRFNKAYSSGNSLFRKFSIPKPYSSTLDIFCLRETRVVNAYRRISLFNHIIEVPHVPLRESVDIHLIPDPERENMHIRIWWNQMMVHSVDLPLSGFRVHF
jgi:transposase